MKKILSAAEIKNLCNEYNELNAQLLKIGKRKNEIQEKVKESYLVREVSRFPKLNAGDKIKVNTISCLGYYKVGNSKRGIKAGDPYYKRKTYVGYFNRYNVASFNDFDGFARKEGESPMWVNLSMTRIRKDGKRFDFSDYYAVRNIESIEKVED